MDAQTNTVYLPMHTIRRMTVSVYYKRGNTSATVGRIRMCQSMWVLGGWVDGWLFISACFAL